MTNPKRPMISNEQFLSGWKQKEYPSGLVALEADLLDGEIDAVEKAFEDVIVQKVEVASQSGDDWHDGAFRATDAVSDQLAQKMARLQEAKDWPVVEMPGKLQTLITLGSRALVQMGRAKFYVDMVGLSLLHQNRAPYEDDEVSMATLNSSLGSALVGRHSDEEVTATIGGRPKEIAVLEVFPSPDLVKE